MARGRQEADWNRTASVLAALAETHRDKKRRSRPFEAREFHPFARRRASQTPKTKDVSILKSLFVDRR